MRSIFNKRQAVNRSLIHLILIIGACTMVLPLVWMIGTSFKPAPEITSWPPHFLPRQWTAENYLIAFRTAPLLRFLLNSLLVGVVCTLTILITSAAAGYVFAKYSFPGKQIIFFAILATIMIPMEIYIVPLYVQMARWHLVNTYLGLFFPNFIASSGVFFMRQNIAGIPDELIDAARIDGASEFKIFPRIIVPLVTSALSALAIFVFMFLWTSFLWPLVITSSKRIMMMELGLSFFESMYTVEYGPLMAASTFAVVPVLVAFIFLRKRVIQSVATTGLAGR